MKVTTKLLIVLMALSIASILLIIDSGVFDGNLAVRTETVYKENKDYFNEIVDFFNSSDVVAIVAPNIMSSFTLYKEIDDYKIYTKSDIELTSLQDDETSKIVEFMIKNEIDIINNKESPFVAFVVIESIDSSAVLRYYPSKPDIQEVKEAAQCNGWFIDEHWLVLDCEDSHYK